MQDSSKRRSTNLDFGHWNDDTAAADYQALKAEKQAIVAELARLPVSQRRARLQRDVRREGERSYQKALHAAAERTAQRARKHALWHAVKRCYASNRPRAHRCTRPAKNIGDVGDAGDGDPEPPSAARDSDVVLLVLSRNTKLGALYQTTVSIEHTCPTSCPLNRTGCYGQRSFIGGQVARLQRAANAAGYSHIDIARAEARMIKKMASSVKPGTPLRLHVAGDAKSEEAARIISEACAEWPGPVFTFTHAWSDVPRDAWGTVSVFASIEHSGDAALAIERGYAPALVVPEHRADGRREHVDGVKYTPCTFQVDKTPCADCKKCLHADALRDASAGIAFAAHGSGKKRVINQLVQLRKKDGTQ